MTHGQVLQEKLTKRPFSILTSFKLTFLPEMSTILTSPIGISEPSFSSSEIATEKARIKNGLKIFFIFNSNIMVIKN